MRRRSGAVALALLLGCAATGCGGSHTATDPRSAGQLLDSADRTMKALDSVTITSETVATGGGTVYSGRQSTDLKSRCTSTARFRSGAELEQIRTGGTDSIHGNDMYFEMWGRETVPAMRTKPWLKSPVGAARDSDGLKDCTWPFKSFGRPTKGARTELGGRPVIPVEVRDKAGQAPFAREPGTYTFYIAAEGTPYLLKIGYQGPHNRATTIFSDFDKPLDLRPPAKTDTLDLGTVRASGAEA
ncbi:hypothetical protein ACFWNW_12230 [Streptomyces seoulensis]|uniref:hypothetical protein n=1 Tax=Streptomyces seoulensis TaxID=73044 RepID=UPI00365ADC52